jgi:ATP-dependent DNA helicase PIF1
MIQLTIIGDFRQCLPVVLKASRAQIVASTISKAIFWKDVVHLKLHINMRLLSQAGQMDPECLQHAQAFAKWLLEIGNGDVPSTSSSEITLPDRKTPHISLFCVRN